MSATLFSTFKIGSLELANRIVISPMCQYSATDGLAGVWHRTHIGNLSLSGAALMLIEATAVAPEGRITPHCLGLYTDEQANALGRVLDDVRQFSEMPIGIQLSHAGRKASSQVPWRGGALITVEDGGWVPFAPSSLAQCEGEAAPAALDYADMRRIREAFATSARRAANIGLAAVELHFAHGYLVHEFLSPLANQRSDQYGGSLDNRLRFPLEVFDAVRAAWPAGRPLGVRVSATDWIPGGWNVEETIELTQCLKQRGCDWIDVSSGGISPAQKIELKPHYQIPFAKAVRAATGMATIGVGLITEPAAADGVIRNGEADLVALGRAFLWNPRWSWHAAAALGVSVKAPPQYWRGPPRGMSKVFSNALFSQR